MATEKVSFRILAANLRKIEVLVKEKEFASKSAFFNASVEDELKKYEESQALKECAGQLEDLEK